MSSGRSRRGSSDEGPGDINSIIRNFIQESMIAITWSANAYDPQTARLKKIHFAEGLKWFVRGFVNDATAREHFDGELKKINQLVDVGRINDEESAEYTAEAAMAVLYTSGRLEKDRRVGTFPWEKNGKKKKEEEEEEAEK